MSRKTKTTATKEEARPALVPKLRFPEFRGAEGWEQVPLGQLADRVTARNLEGDCTRVLTNSAERGVLDQRDYFEKDIATAGNLEGYYVVNRGDYVYNPRISNVAPVGPISRNNIGQGVMSPLYTVFRFKSKNTDFYSHYFKTTCWHSYLRQVASTGARHDRMSISIGDFVAMPLPVLSSAEQQKIAECLSSVDELMVAQARKVDALKTHKKGLMQQLFPREGETEPRLRFPEFQNAGEWAKDSMQGVFVFRQGLQVAIEHQFMEDGDGRERFIRIIDVTQNNEPPRYIAVTNNAYTLSVNDLFMIRYGTPGVVSIGYEGVIANNLFQLIFRIQEIHSPFFWYYFLQTKYEEISGLSGSSSMPAISFKTLNNIGVEYPSLPEQKRIASCLTSLDALIAAETQKLDALKTHKKGLMQQLFPSVGGVAGEA
ncbi:MAG: restriction endonuclease subunit S [Desulfovibrionales bacterium]|nr:restriction endonuclease subunit S [Desulfovibrionales bacterium]